MAAIVSFRHHNLNDEHYTNMNMNHNIGHVHLVPNPHFTFPAHPNGDNTQSLDTQRPASMQSASNSHRSRGMRQSASALPTFSFNATDTSGLTGPQDLSPTGLTIPSPSKSIGHRRGASELVGGDSRLGLSGVVGGTSPLKHLDTLPVPLPVPEITSTTGSPSRRRGHAHRRSAAISSHDLTSILQPRDVNVQSPPGSSPQTPSDRIIPTQYFSTPKTVTESPAADIEHGTSPASSVASAEDGGARPPSRLRVGFSENVEYIPRPLSTVSSETASSASTARGHSFGNSISSVISLGGIGNPSPRRSPVPANDLSPEILFRSRLSPESSKTTEPAEWASRPRSQRPVSESFVPDLDSVDVTEAPVDSEQSTKKRTFLKLDRRRSEPLISLTASAEMGVSTISLQEPVSTEKCSETSEGNAEDLQRKSSRKRVKKWASSILSRKIKDARKTRSNPGFGEGCRMDISTSEPSTPLAESIETSEEPDLDALFSQDPFTDDTGSSTVVAPAVGMSNASFPLFSLPARNADDRSSVIDLDAALGPYGTPSMSWEFSRPNTSAARRQLHSSRLTKDFTGPGMHYHRRTESAPALVPFEFGRASSPGQSPMADVFEEEEDEAASTSTEEPSVCDDAEEELGTGIEVVDTANDPYDQSFDWSFDDGPSVERNASGRAAHSFNLAVPHLSAPPAGVRRTSVVEDTIIEEASPLEIVEDHEEPRTSSLTKSSESSDTRTISAHQSTLILPISQPQSCPLTPTSYAASNFSSPDLSRHQESFDASRLGTSASSIADNRTMSSFAMGEPGPEVYMSTDDVPSLTSSRSTMISTMCQGSSSRRDYERPGTVACSNSQAEMQASERRRKRSSIQSLSKLMGGPFGESRSKLGTEQRPQTAVALSTLDEHKRKKENRLSKLMFWRSKSDSRAVFHPK